MNKTSNNEPLLTAQASNGGQGYTESVQDADNNGEEEPFDVTILGSNDTTENAGLNLNGVDDNEESLKIVAYDKNLSKPLQIVFELHAFHAKKEVNTKLLPLTFVVSFVWVAFFSFIGTCVRIKVISYPLFHFYIFCHI